MKYFRQTSIKIIALSVGYSCPLWSCVFIKNLTKDFFNDRVEPGCVKFCDRMPLSTLRTKCLALFIPTFLLVLIAINSNITKTIGKVTQEDFANLTDVRTEGKKSETENVENITFSLSHCPCQRTVQVTKDRVSSSNRTRDEDSSKYNETTCGYDSFLRGFNQKIIAFTFYLLPKGERPKSKKYFKGIESNLNLLQKFYPGWVIRLYHDIQPDTGPHRKLCKIACNDNNIDLCYVRQLPGNPVIDAGHLHPPIWRFFPTLDPQVSLFLSRDLDSQFSDREVSAVEEWVESGQALHVMRDNPEHGVAMLAGTWGARLDTYREMWRGKHTG